jgi:4-hydroxybenzoyl-CoA reductase subunit beta
VLRLPQFDVALPATIDEVVRALARPGARIVAGGTDLLPNLKHRLGAPPEVLVSLARVAALREVTLDAAAGVLAIGAGVTLTDVARHPEVVRRFPSLAEAAGVVASPLIRNAGTLGGNVNLDTRCRYVNQTHFWRSAIGGCLKSEGDVCHVVPGGKSCVAAMSSDCVPVLCSLDAEVVLRSARGERVVAIDDYYDTDGRSHIKRAPDELTTAIRIPLPRVPIRATYQKWTVRKSIDFPLVSIALRFDLDRDAADATITRAVAVLGVLAARPKRLKLDAAVGRRLDDPAVHAAIADLVGKQGKPLDNVPYEAAYRRKMLPVYAERAVRRLASDPR